jgi:hypothetical protein
MMPDMDALTSGPTSAWQLLSEAGLLIETTDLVCGKDVSAYRYSYNALLLFGQLPETT